MDFSLFFSEPSNLQDVLRKDVENHTNGTLIFDPTSKDHEGKYTCEIDNGAGESLKKIVALIVHGRMYSSVVKYKLLFQQNFLFGIYKNEMKCCKSKSRY